MKTKDIKREFTNQFELRLYKRGILISTLPDKKEISLWSWIEKKLQEAYDKGFEEGYIKGDNGKHKIGICGASVFVTQKGGVCTECGKLIEEGK